MAEEGQYCHGSEGQDIAMAVEGKILPWQRVEDRYCHGSEGQDIAMAGQYCHGSEWRTDIAMAEKWQDIGMAMEDKILPWQ